LESCSVKSGPSFPLVSFEGLFLNGERGVLFSPNRRSLINDGTAPFLKS